MKIVLVSDIHANVPALEAFLKYLKDSSLSDAALYLLGDYVNLGPFPEETIQMLRSLSAKVFLAGNHDRYIINERALDHNPYFGSKQGVLHCRWTRNQLSPESLHWLSNLETRHQTDIGAYHLDMTHGRLGSDEETFDVSSIKTDAKILYICGHTHVPRNQSVGQARILNPGSLGKPLDTDNRASFGILDINGEDAHFEVVRIPYDVERTVKALQDRKVPWRTGIINSLRTAIYTDED